MKQRRYTVEPGRHIYRDGKPLISIGREGETRPVDADALTHRIALLLEMLDGRLKKREEQRIARNLKARERRRVRNRPDDRAP